MSDTELQAPLLARTVPSAWITRQAAGEQGWQDVTAGEPYQRIVGLVTPERQELWTPSRVPLDQNSTYDRAIAGQIELPFTSVQAAGLVSFFDTFLSARAAGSIKTDYNCYRFAAWMQQLTEERFALPDSLANNIVREGERQSRNLKLGELGVIGYRTGKPSEARARHSVIGLGEDRDECLQVMWLFGHLGIASYKSILNFHEERIKNRYEKPPRSLEIGLYTAAA